MNFPVIPQEASRDRSGSLSSETSFDEDFFLKTYVPLSNLPTPPLSSCSTDNSRQQSPEALLASCEVRDPELLGPAIHLTNLIPSSVSRIAPSMPLVHTILTRADLPLETIALAVCILDSLSSRFALSWRRCCPLESPPASPIRETFLEEHHIDAIHPEVIAMCALILAHKFVVDAPEPTTRYAKQWGHGLWSCSQINVTQRCLMENIGYRLKPLWDEDIIIGALEDMQRAVMQHQDWSDFETESFVSHHDLGDSHGKALQGHGFQDTPADTPMTENMRGTKDVSIETRMAFSAALQQEFRCSTDFWLPDKKIEEPFPAYEDTLEALNPSSGFMCSLGAGPGGEPLLGFCD